MDSGLRKCDGAARAAVAERGPHERLEVLVRVNGSTRSVRDALERSGLEVHSAIGPVATGIIPAGKLAELADLSFVRRVELSRALFSEE